MFNLAIGWKLVCLCNNKLKYCYLHFFLCISFLVSMGVKAQTDKTISVLIIDGFSNHDWEQTTEVTKWILKESGRFKVDVSTIPVDSNQRSSWLPKFGKYEVVIQNTNNIDNPDLQWPKKAEQKLETYVAEGGGLYILHSANNAFPHWEEYDEMMGLGWRPVNVGFSFEIDPKGTGKKYGPREGEATSHGNRFDALIEIYNRHPINKDFPDAWRTVNTEIYSFPRGPAKNLTILSYAYDKNNTQKYWPVEWVVAYGKGRVYNSSLGHLWVGEEYPPAYRCVGYQTTLIRAAEWLATGEVSYQIPADFPMSESASLRPKASFKAVSDNE